MQALETTTTSDELIDKLLLELKKDRIKGVSKITNQRIKGYLKKLRYTKQYEHIPAIINKLCGIPPPVITRELQKKVPALLMVSLPRELSPKRLLLFLLI